MIFHNKYVQPSLTRGTTTHDYGGSLFVEPWASAHSALP